MTLNEKDWQLINAYADGELEPSARRALEARLESEPELRAALDRVMALKGTLSRMRPVPTAEDLPEVSAMEPENAVLSRRPGRRVWRPAVAAALALLLLPLGYVLFFTQTAPLNPADWHGRFADRSYTVTPAAEDSLWLAKLGLGQAPDLSSAGLTLVDMQVERSGERQTGALHYRGQRGCRVTLVVDAKAVDAKAVDPKLVDPSQGQASQPAAKGAQQRQWQAGPARFTLLASGMDPDRFWAIGSYLEAMTRRALDVPEMRTAMSDATAQAAPCA